MINDLQVYRLEEIRDEITGLIDEAEAIVASTDNQDIADKTDNWLKVIRKNVCDEVNILTVQTIIDDLWFEWHVSEHIYEVHNNE